MNDKELLRKIDPTLYDKIEIIGCKFSSEQIKSALDMMNSNIDNDFNYDYADDYVLSDECYIIREIDDDIYIERVNHTDQDEDEGFERLQKIICDNPKDFLYCLDNTIFIDKVNNAKELLRQHNL